MSHVGMVRAATRWPTNGHMIEDVVKLGYLHPAWHTIDPTYGRGKWWTRWRPDHLTTHRRKADGTDFRSLPYRDGAFDCAAYDPVYVCPGGKPTSNIGEMHDRYGMADPEFSTPAELQDINHAGLTELARLVRPPARRRKGTVGGGGFIIVKCKDYIWGGGLWDGTGLMVAHARTLGLKYVDRLEHLGDPGPQSQKVQVHARRNLSTLLVFQVPGVGPVRPPAPADQPTLTEGATGCDAASVSPTS